MIPIINKNIVPIKYEYFFNILLIYFPSESPRNVNEKLHNENTEDDNSKLFVIAFKPNPTVKLSIETPNAKNKVPYLFNDISLFDGFRYSINNCNDNNNKIIPNIISESISNILLI